MTPQNSKNALLSNKPFAIMLLHDQLSVNMKTVSFGEMILAGTEREY